MEEDEWFCFKCKEKVEEVDLNLSYLGMEGVVSGLICPKCKEVYLTEDVVVGQIVNAEKTIEAKG